MFNPVATIVTAIGNTKVTEDAVLIKAARSNICWHDPIAVELNRRITEPLLRHLSDEDLQALLDTNDASTIINETLIENLG